MKPKDGDPPAFTPEERAQLAAKAREAIKGLQRLPEELGLEHLLPGILGTAQPPVQHTITRPTENRAKLELVKPRCKRNPAASALVKAWRTDRNISQIDFASQVGIGADTLGELENDLGVTSSVWDKVAVRIDMEVSDLLKTPNSP